MTPTLYLMLALALAAPITYGITKVRAIQAEKAAYQQGRADGQASVSKEAVTSAAETTATFREELEKVIVPTERAKLIELCKRRASCIDREKALRGELR